VFMLSPFLAKILRCPACKGTLTQDEQNSRLCCDDCRLGYAVADGVPVMLIDQATPCTQEH